MRRWTTWLAYGAVLWSTAGMLTYFFGYAGDRRLFLPGETTHGHYQIELKCSECHTPLMGVKTDSCNRCHGAELAAVRDSHPRSKFTDPRNAELLTQLNAAECVTCHREHRPESTGAMGVSVPEDVCYHCHKDIARERPSHAGMGFKTCATAGCHNFHDNSALYEDFIAKHTREPEIRARAARVLRTAVAASPEKPALTGTDRVAPADVSVDQSLIYEWEQSAHAHARVNCADCHQNGDTTKPWLERPTEASCARCHESAVQGFQAGRHGMRLAAGLPAMTPGESRLPMRPESAHRTLSCSSCHESHRYDTRTAAVESCIKCHNDRHTQAYTGSPHHRTWLAELAGEAAPGTGVSCATCHLPRETHRVEGRDVVRVQHNQNANLRPNEKMLRTACLDCHGYAFALDALADRALIDANFSGRPARHLETVEMVVRRLVSEASPQPQKENQP